MPPGPRNNPIAPELLRLDLSKYELCFPCGALNVLPIAITAEVKTLFGNIQENTKGNNQSQRKFSKIAALLTPNTAILHDLTLTSEQHSTVSSIFNAARM